MRKVRYFAMAFQNDEHGKPLKHEKFITENLKETRKLCKNFIGIYGKYVIHRVVNGICKGYTEIYELTPDYELLEKVGGKR